ncbi:hypothetical protein A1D23_10485 [Chelonobacter oris]|nr:hypothetical protein [Chelonobacter oris]
MKLTGRTVLVTGGMLTALACLFPLEVVVVWAADDKPCYLHGREFELSWRHSVEHQLWREHYRREGNGFLLEQTWLQTFGAGTPSQGEPVRAPEGYIGYRQRIRLAEINWVVSTNMQGELTAQQQSIPIYRLVSDYSEVRITASRTALIVFLWGRTCHEWASEAGFSRVATHFK